MGQFEEILEFTLKEEGGYVNDPADPGGETNFGISKRSYPDLDIKNLTRSMAVDIYKRDYWVAPHFNLLPRSWAFACFDTGVNAGQGSATKFLQEVLGIKVDGIVGPRTTGASWLNLSRDALDNYLARRIQGITFHNPNPLIRRVFRLRDLIYFYDI